SQPFDWVNLGQAVNCRLLADGTGRKEYTFRREEQGQKPGPGAGRHSRRIGFIAKNRASGAVRRTESPEFRNSVGDRRRRRALEASKGLRNCFDYGLVSGRQAFSERRPSAGIRGVEMFVAGRKRRGGNRWRPSLLLGEPG